MLLPCRLIYGLGGVCFNDIPLPPRGVHAAGSDCVLDAGVDHGGCGDRDFGVFSNFLADILFAGVDGERLGGIDALVEGDKVVVDLLLFGLAVIEFDVVRKLSDGDAGEAFGWIVELSKNPVFERS